MLDGDGFSSRVGQLARREAVAADRGCPRLSDLAPVGRARGGGGTDMLQMKEAGEEGEPGAPTPRPATMARAEHQIEQEPLYPCRAIVGR